MVCFFVLAVVSTCTCSAQLPANRYNSIESYETLLKMQEDLIKSFETLLKNTTFTEVQLNQSSKFLASFNDLAYRQQRGIYSFEDLVTYNWTELSTQQKINFTDSYEALLHSEFSVLSSNEDLLKREFCKLDHNNQTTFLNEFESRIKFEKLLLSKFEDWLHYQQTIEMNTTTNAAWFRFLNSFESLIREQSMLLSSFEDLAKSRCDTNLMSLNLSVDKPTYVPPNAPTSFVPCGTPVTYKLKVCNNGTTDIQNVTLRDYLSGENFVVATLASGACQTFTINSIAKCVDCTNCTCKVSDWAWVSGEVVTANGNYTITVYSTQQTIAVDCRNGLPPYPGAHLTAQPAAQSVQNPQVDAVMNSDQTNVEVTKSTEVTAKAQNNKPCPTCGKK